MSAWNASAMMYLSSRTVYIKTISRGRRKANIYSEEHSTARNVTSQLNHTCFHYPSKQSKNVLYKWKNKHQTTSHIKWQFQLHSPKKSQRYKFNFLMSNKHGFLISVGITGMLLDTTAPHTLINDEPVEVSRTQNNTGHETKTEVHLHDIQKYRPSQKTTCLSVTKLIGLILFKGKSLSILRIIRRLRKTMDSRTHSLTHAARSYLKRFLPQLVKKFPAFYGTRRIITAFTSVRYLFLYSARNLQPIRPLNLFL